MLWTRSELIEALGDNLLDYNLSDDLQIDEVVIDSRKAVKNTLFLALKGEINDAHDFLNGAAQNGCETFLIQDNKSLKKAEHCDFLLVKDSFDALYRLAKFSRNRSEAKIIAITGSVGKTSVKEMLKIALSEYGKTYATIGNLNNHIGLPLSLCNFAADCEFGIFEMGMNHLDEIKPLSLLTKPHLAIITNVGPVHIEHFKDEQEIALAKSEIFIGLCENGTALINSDNSHCNFIKNQAIISNVAPNKILTFGKNSKNFCQLKSYKINSSNLSEVSVARQDGSEINYKISTSNKVLIFNSVIVAASLEIFTNNSRIGLLKLRELENTSGRGKISDKNIGNKQITIIDDSYNASTISIRAGLEHISELKCALQKTRTVAALGDMLELGDKSSEMHEEIAKYLQQFGIDFALLVGEKMTEAAKNLPKNSYMVFPDSNSLSLDIKELLQDGDILYVKGSRGMKMEKIIEKIN